MKLKFVTATILGMVFSSSAFATFDLSIVNLDNSTPGTLIFDVKATSTAIEDIGAFGVGLEFPDIGAGSVDYSYSTIGGFAHFNTASSSPPSGTVPVPDGTSINPLFLGGPLSFTAGSMETLATITISDIQPSEVFNVVLGAGSAVGTDLSPTFGSFGVSSVAVPEPSAFLLMGLVGLGWLGVKRFRIKK